MTAARLGLLLLVSPSMLWAWTSCAVPATARQRRSGSALRMSRATHGDGRRTSRVGQMLRVELANVIRDAHSVGTKRIPASLQQLISIVDVDVSPDLRNARVKVSIIGDRKDKVTAVRWLRGNVKGLRHELAQRNRHMKRIPAIMFDHVDVGAATDMMVKLEELRRESDSAARARGEPLDDDDGGMLLDFDGEDADGWLDDDDFDDDFDDDDFEDA